MRLEFDVRFEAIPTLVGDGFIAAANLFYPGIECDDGGARPRQVSLVLFANSAQLALIGLKPSCGADDDDGISFMPAVVPAKIPGSGWHHVALALGDDRCDGPSAPGAVRLAFDGATACFAVDPASVVPPGATVDLNFGLLASRSARTSETRAFFDNMTLDVD